MLGTLGHLVHSQVFVGPTLRPENLPAIVDKIRAIMDKIRQGKNSIITCAQQSTFLMNLEDFLYCET